MAKNKDSEIPLNHRAFVRHYLLYRHITKAAIHAGFPKKSACSQGSRLLKTAKIQAIVAEYEAQLKKEYKISEKIIIQELARTGFDPIGLVVSAAGKHPLESFHVGALLTTYAGQKTASLKLLGQHIGMWGKDGKATAEDGRETVLKRMSAHFRKRKPAGSEPGGT